MWMNHWLGTNFSYLQADWEVTKCDEVKQRPEHKSMLPSGKQVTFEPVYNLLTSLSYISNMENPKITIWPYFSASSSRPSISVFFKQKRTTFHNRSTKLLYRSIDRSKPVTSGNSSFNSDGILKDCQAIFQWCSHSEQMGSCRGSFQDMEDIHTASTT